MPRKRLTARNLAQHDAAMSEPDPPQLTADNLARHNAAMSESELHKLARERFARRDIDVKGPRPDQLSFENLARHDAATSDLSGKTPGKDGSERSRLTHDNLARHDATMKNRRHAADEEQRPNLLRDDFDYGNIGWHRAEHREGRGGLWEPRARRRK